MSVNLFTLAPQDQSIYYLGQIFGSIGGVLPVSSGPILLGLMFKVLNTAALSVGALIVVYTTVAGLLSTASEGEFLGKKWSGTWVPIRTVLGIVGLFPSSGGYCAIQIVIMWLILQGVGLADTLWSAVLQLVDKGGSPYVTTSFPNVSGGQQQNFKNLFTGLVCYESLHRKDGVTSFPGPYLCRVKPDDDRCKSQPTNQFNPGVFPPIINGNYDLGAECGGALTYCNPNPTIAKSPCTSPNSLPCILCVAQNQALSEIIPTFSTLAKSFVQMDFDYQKFYYTSSNTNQPAQAPDWIQNFCTANGLQGKCCVGLNNVGLASLAEFIHDTSSTASQNLAACSYSFFSTSYSPNRIGNNKGPGSVGQAVLKDIYMPGIQSYTNNVDFIKAATDQYQGVLNAAYLTYLASLPTKATSDAWNREAQNNGWILAGMYYMQITQKSANNLPSEDNLPKLSFPMVPNPEAPDSLIQPYRNNINAMPDLFKYLSDAEGNDNSDIATSSLNTIQETSWTSMNSMLSQFMHDISGRPGELAVNPLYNISLWGYRMMITVQLIFAVTVVVMTAVTALASTNFMVIGTGMTSPMWYEALKAAWGFTSPFLMLAMSALFSIGAVLGIYLPLIPYTIFLMGAVGWLMATIEAMVAGPIIALGILSPSGQHELLGKAEPAVMIIFNLILRPALMVFGMMASMLLAVVVVTMINQGFAKVAFNIIQAPGLVEGIFFMIAYTSLLVTALSKVFSLIHVIPEKILTYIGGQAISYGESEGLQGMKQTMEGGASGISSGGKEAGGAPAAGVAKVGQDDAHVKADDENKGVEAGKGVASQKRKEQNRIGRGGGGGGDAKGGGGGGDAGGDA